MVKRQLFVFQLVVNPGELHSVKRRDDQRRVGKQRQADMHQHPRRRFQMGNELIGHKRG